MSVRLGLWASVRWLMSRPPGSQRTSCASSENWNPTAPHRWRNFYFASTTTEAKAFAIRPHQRKPKPARETCHRYPSQSGAQLLHFTSLDHPSHTLPLLNSQCSTAEELSVLKAWSVPHLEWRSPFWSVRRTQLIITVYFVSAFFFTLHIVRVSVMSSPSSDQHWFVADLFRPLSVACLVFSIHSFLICVFCKC